MTVDVNYSSVSLLLHCDGSNNGTTFTDNSPSGHTVTPSGGAVTSTAQKLYGTASLLIGSSSDKLTVTSHADFALGTGSFTVECAVYVTSYSPTQPGLLNVGTYATGILWRINSTEIAMWIVGNEYKVTYSVPTGQWVRLAVVKHHDYFYYFADGSYIGQKLITGSPSIPQNDIVIGQSAHSSAEYLNGYIDEVRITKGVARYLDTYTVDTKAFGNHGTSTISGNITESLAVTAWRVTAYRCSDGAYAGSTTTTGSSYSVATNYDDPCHVTIAPKIDYQWNTLIGTAALGAFCVPANPESTPHLFECTTSGAVGGSEPTWDTTPGNTTNDSSAVWTCIGPLVDPITIGPKIPA